MAKLMYSMLTSLDGYVADNAGNFQWATPNEEVHAFIDDLERNTGTFLLGRRMYEVLAVWDTIPDDGPSPAVNEYGKIWRAAKKIVYSTSLSKPTTKSTEIEHEFNAPVIVGEGNYWLPKDIHIKLKLVDIQKFEGGVQVHGKGISSFVYLH